MAKPPAVDRPFESLFITPIDVPQKNIDTFIEKLKSAVTNEKGTVKSVQIWGRRRLSYPIKRHKDGMYIYMDFNGGATVPEAVNSLYKVTDFVIRYITVHRDDSAPVPAAAAAPVEGADAAAAGAPATTAGTPAPAAAAPAAVKPASEVESKESPSPKKEA